MVFGGDICL